MDFIRYLLYIASVSLSTNCFKVQKASENEVDQTEQGSLFFKSVPHKRTEARLGERLVIDCEAGGSPSPTIHWLFNGQRISQGGSDSVFDDAPYYEMSTVPHVIGLATTKSRLFIDCVTLRDSGDYTCVADTPQQRITSNTIVTLGNANDVGYFENCMEKRQPGSDSAARVFMWTAQRLEIQGLDIQLYCRSTGYPAPKTSWYDKKGQLITRDRQGFKILENGDLIIHDLEFVKHMGLFKCVAENGLGKDEVATFVYPTSLRKNKD